MKKNLKILAALLIGGITFGQVGINNPSSNVTLEVTAKQTDGSTSEGIIAPRLTGDALHQAELSSKYGELQDGTIAYVTAVPSAGNAVGQTISIDAKGYYYFDSTPNKWMKFRCGCSDDLGTVATLDCAGATITGTLTSGLSASVTASVPYTGGNGQGYPAQTVNSTGVTGLTATLPAGTLSNGPGNIIYTITGTPSAAGTASFAISLGDKSCTLNIPVAAACGALISPGLFKNFMCHNLGANMTADPFTPSAAIHGAKYQWGAQTGETGRYYSQANDQTNAGAIAGWNTTALPDGTWSDTFKTAKDPCPAGYRLPTKLQWDGVVANNAKTFIGPFAESPANYSSAIKLGNGLLLPAAGSRLNTSGTVIYHGSSGLYWSSTQNTAVFADYLDFDGNGIAASRNPRTYGFSIRCISE